MRMTEPENILLMIDDDRLFCDAVQLFFSARNIQVTSFQHGRDAIDWYRENQAAVVLLDQKLPDTTGIELCTDILGLNEQVKIIFITAFPSFEHAVEALRRGACDYLSKPMELDELALAVERAFRTVELERLE